MMEMNLDFKRLSLETGTSPKSPVGVSLAAYALVVLIFVGDWVTPALVAVGLAYQAPVVFAGLKGTRHLTIQVTMLGIVGLLLGWFMDFAADSFRLNADRIENRLLSVLSLLIVSCLTLKAQRNDAALSVQPPV